MFKSVFSAVATHPYTKPNRSTSSDFPWKSFLISPFHLRLRLPSGLLPSGFPTISLYVLVSRMYHVSRPSCFHLITQIEVIKLFSCNFVPLISKHASQHPFPMWKTASLLTDPRFIPRRDQVHYLQVKTFPESSYGILCHLSFPEYSRLQTLN